MSKSYLLRESAVTLRRSSMEEEGKIPRLIRHCTPLRCANCRFCSTELEDDDSGNAASIGASVIVFRQFFKYPVAYNWRKTQAFAAIFSRRNLHNVGAETEEDARIQLNRIAFQRKSLWDLKNENLWERSEKRVMEERNKRRN